VESCRLGSQRQTAKHPDGDSVRVGRAQQDTEVHSSHPVTSGANGKSGMVGYVPASEWSLVGSGVKGCKSSQMVTDCVRVGRAQQDTEVHSSHPVTSGANGKSGMVGYAPVFCCLFEVCSSANHPRWVSGVTDIIF
jgi:hypothetical protein